jgi:hydrogenase maturation factor
MELAVASGVGLEVVEDNLPIAPCTARLCAEFELEPLGVLSSGALLIGCGPESAGAIVAALQGAGIPAARIGVVRPAEYGLRLRRGDRAEPLPRYEVDEIARLFGG